MLYTVSDQINIVQVCHNFFFNSGLHYQISNMCRQHEYLIHNNVTVHPVSY